LVGGLLRAVHFFQVPSTPNKTNKMCLEEWSVLYYSLLCLFFFFFLCVQIDMKLIKNSKSAFDFECTHNTLLIRPLQLALLTTFSLISSLSKIFSKCEKDLLELLLRIVFFNWFFFFYSYKFLLISIMSLEL